MSDGPEWQLFVSATERAVVAKEIQDAGLSKREAAMLQKLLDRIALGQVLKKDVKWLTDYKLLEARLDGDHRIFRLLFIRRGEGKILVGLSSQRRSPRSFPRASLRLLKSGLASGTSVTTPDGGCNFIG